MINTTYSIAYLNTAYGDKRLYPTYGVQKTTLYTSLALVLSVEATRVSNNDFDDLGYSLIYAVIQR